VAGEKLLCVWTRVIVAVVSLAVPRPNQVPHWHVAGGSLGDSSRIETEDWEIRAALDAHWAASDANDFELKHQIYREDAVLEYPQAAERIRGRRNIQASRFAQPSMMRFTVRRILGAADLWVTEFVLTYDGQPSYTVSIMEFKDGVIPTFVSPAATSWII
jgi:hypothetical protein